MDGWHVAATHDVVLLLAWLAVGAATVVRLAEAGAVAAPRDHRPRAREVDRTVGTSTLLVAAGWAA